MNIVRAEWTKLRTTPGPAWLLLATVTATVALGAAVDAAVGAAASCPPAGCGPDAARLALSGVYLGQAPVAVLGVLSISGEYSTRLIRVTLTAIPHRPAVLAAKALVLTVVVAAAGSLAVLGSLLVAGIGPAGGAALRAGAGTVAYLALVAVLSLGTAALVRDSAAAIGTVLGLLFLPPVLTQLVTDEHLRRLLDEAAPGPSARIGVVAAWSAGLFLAGTLRLRFRDT